MNNLRFDIDLQPGQAGKNCQAAILSENKSTIWSIGGRHDYLALNRLDSGDVLQFAHETKKKGWLGLFSDAELVIRNLSDTPREVARLKWEAGKGGTISFPGIGEFPLTRHKGDDPAVTGKCIRISIIALKSRLIVPMAFAPLAEALMIAGWKIIQEEYSEMHD